MSEWHRRVREWGGRERHGRVRGREDVAWKSEGMNEGVAWKSEGVACAVACDAQ